MTNVKNLPDNHRGLAVGVLATSFGLSSALFTNLYRALFDKPGESDGVDDYLLMVVLTLSSFCVLGVLGLRLTHSPSGVASTEDDPSRIKSNSSISEADFKEATITGRALCLNDEFQLLFLLFLLSASSGLSMIGEISDMATSSGYTDADKLQMISVVSYSNSGGRLLFGLMSDRTQHFLPRAFWISICSLLMCATHVAMALWETAPNALWLGAVGCCKSAC